MVAERSGSLCSRSLPSLPQGGRIDYDCGPADAAEPSLRAHEAGAVDGPRGRRPRDACELGHLVERRSNRLGVVGGHAPGLLSVIDVFPVAGRTVIDMIVWKRFHRVEALPS